jgi:prophage antirepressor-like protein
MTITPFNFNGTELRAISRDGEPWFIASDVCTVLEHSNSRKAITSLEDDEKGVTISDTPGGPQEFAIINESGLYSLVLRSRKPQAKAFKKWVTSEVLPAIRKTGGYQVASTAILPQDYATALRQLADKYEETEKLKLTIETQRPAVEYVERFVKADGLFGIRETAKILGVKQNAFVDLCQGGRVLFRENGSLQPYAKWLDAGYFEVKTGEANEHAFKQTRFTSKGLEWVRSYLAIDQLLGTSNALTLTQA